MALQEACRLVITFKCTENTEVRMLFLTLTSLAKPAIKELRLVTLGRIIFQVGMCNRHAIVLIVMCV